jgi:predicted ester cyclase
MFRILTLSSLIAALAGCSVEDPCRTNKAIVRNYMEQVVNQGKSGMCTIYFSKKLRFNGAEISPQALTMLIDSMRAPFPDLHLTIEDQIAEGDIVVTRVTFRGTHLRKVNGVMPTGKAVRFMGVAIDRLEADKVVEMWHSTEDSEVTRLLASSQGSSNES